MELFPKTIFKLPIRLPSCVFSVWRNDCWHWHGQMTGGIVLAWRALRLTRRCTHIGDHCFLFFAWDWFCSAWLRFVMCSFGALPCLLQWPCFSCLCCLVVVVRAGCWLSVCIPVSSSIKALLLLLLPIFLVRCPWTTVPFPHVPHFISHSHWRASALNRTGKILLPAAAASRLCLRC